MPYLPAVDLRRLRGRAAVRTDVDAARPATTLELFFDLTLVVGVARAAEALHHQLVEVDAAHGLLGFAGAFFGVWWAWMNFTWFASAHDSDDVAHRLLALVQMAGALVLAAGVSRAVEHGEYVVATIGYVIMRVGLLASWLRVARDHPAQRARATRYAAGLLALQVGWLARLALPSGPAVAGFAVLGAGELALPYLAERAGEVRVFHPGHIEERYGLFTLIVLGESILSASTGFQSALDERGLTARLLALGVSGLLVAFAAWWIYFDHPGHLSLTPTQAFRWGYAHLAVFTSLAALGAGIRVAADALTGRGDSRTAALACALPTAGFLLALALVMTLTGTPVRSPRVLPKLAGAAVLVVLGLTLSVTGAVVACAVVMVALVSAMILTDDRRDAPA